MRPTTRDLADAHEDLEVIAYAHDPNGSPRNNTGFRDAAKLLNFLAWLDGEIKANERGAAYGQGIEGGYHVLQRGGQHSDLDARTHDAHAKALRNLRSGCLVELGRVVDGFVQDGIDQGRYPTRSEQAV